MSDQGAVPEWAVKLTEKLGNRFFLQWDCDETEVARFIASHAPQAEGVVVPREAIEQVREAMEYALGKPGELARRATEEIRLIAPCHLREYGAAIIQRCIETAQEAATAALHRARPFMGHLQRCAAMRSSADETTRCDCGYPAAIYALDAFLGDRATEGK